ncbi:hypothetical protein [Butyricicoccus sp.]|uniref:hypothetical protein n=1 Tax=Butyricicoccus sp. TaxID=2049021 RepID=UPI003D7D977E
MEPENKTNYQVKLVEEKSEPVQPERLEEDPLENLPDLSSQTGGLPIVTFILVCLSAGIILLIERVLTVGSVPIAVGCIAFILMALFGIVALIRGMFQKLHAQKEQSSAYTLSAAVMTIGILVGLIIGVVSSF